MTHGRAEGDEDNAEGVEYVKGHEKLDKDFLCDDVRFCLLNMSPPLKEIVLFVNNFSGNIQYIMQL